MALKRAFNSHAVVREVVQMQIDLARHSHVPLCNLPQAQGGDKMGFVCDVLYARALKKNNHILWVSPTNRPDLGGKEDDDNRYCFFYYCYYFCVLIIIVTG